MLNHYWALYQGGEPVCRRDPAGHLVPLVFTRRGDARCYPGTVVKIIMVPVELIDPIKKRRRRCRKT